MQYVSKIIAKAYYSRMHRTAMGLVFESNAIQKPQLTKEAKRMFDEEVNDSLRSIIDQIDIGGYGSSSYASDIDHSLIDFYEVIQGLQAKGVKVYGLYGQSEPRLSEEHIVKLRNIIGVQNVKYLDHSGHGIILQRRQAVIKIISQWLK